MCFRHVETLISHGFNAVIATPDAHRPTWLETSAPVLGIDEITSEEDILVFPENHPEFLPHFKDRQNTKYVFAQSWFMISRGLCGKRDYRDFGVSRLFTVSQFAADVYRKRFKGLDVSIIWNYVDTLAFAMNKTKQLRILFDPRKRASEANFIQDFFWSLDEGNRSIPWVPLKDLTEAQVQQAMGSSAIFLSVGRFESFSLTPLEAMSCGCLVVGFTGQGARDYATTCNGFWVQEDDVVGCSERLNDAVQVAKSGGPAFTQRIEAAREAPQAYSKERFERSLLQFWSK